MWHKLPKTEIHATGRDGKLTFATEVRRCPTKSVLGTTDLEPFMISRPSAHIQLLTFNGHVTLSVAAYGPHSASAPQLLVQLPEPQNLR
jgi:hypothetical protein